ncbi:hypothetical protein BIW11_07406 [Tropilaelaps mercedesae]|uniref:Uncharacterized protein n=1 Tax=Tropilaelaps mercedesae TaxID=418985 RepID=A0A1V9XU38_9ACAR|nr:hypothetical protein BIW11_07406 [Tropilaelaps mercedesae]
MAAGPGWSSDVTGEIMPTVDSRFHQHPLRESMIEPIPPNARRPLSPGERREVLQMVPAVPRRLPLVPIEPMGAIHVDMGSHWRGGGGVQSPTGGPCASAYFSRRPLSPVSQNNANNIKRSGGDDLLMGSGLRGPDMRRQSVATDSPAGSLQEHRGVSNPLAKFFVNPLERSRGYGHHGRHGSRFSVAEPPHAHGGQHRIY